MSGGIFVNHRWHAHRCVICDQHFECFCESPGSVVKFICEECQKEDA